MRGVAKYIWVFLFIAFVGGFLLADMSGLIGMAPVTSSTVVAKVNGKEIPYLAWESLTRQLVQQQEQQRGRSVDLDERRQLEEQAFEQLVSDLLLQEEYERRGIRVTDQEIVDAARYSPPPQFYQVPELQTDGRFDPAKYQRYLESPMARQQGLLAQLEAYYRSDIPRNRLISQLVSDVWVSNEQLWQDFRDERDSVRVTYVALRPDSAQIAAAAVSDAEARRFYDNLKGRWSAPGRALVSVVSVSRIPTAADTAATVARLRALRQDIVSGRSTFEDVARRESVDTISGPDGGDLGRAPRGRFVPAFEDAAFALRVGQVSEPVPTQFGWHLIKATERKGDTLAVRHILLDVKQSDSAATLSDRRADRMALVAGGSSEPARLDSVAAELGLLITQVPVVEGQTAQYLGRPVGSLSGWTFSGSRVGDISDLLDDDDGYYLVRVDSLTPGGEQPFTAVKADIVRALKERKAVEALVARAEAIATDARTSSLEAAAAKAELTPGTAGPFTRLGFVPGLGFYNEAVGAAFGLPLGTIGVARTDEAVFVLRPDARTEASRAAFETERSFRRERALQAAREARVREYLEAMRRSATVVDRRREINAQLRRQVVE